MPIVKMSTNWGFEGDLAVGGHNGADTSAFAGQQESRYASFTPVVLALKTILAQTKLDEPFCGGLGSYKLYVMVAYHLEKHLSIGGRDQPSEVLLLFWFRFAQPFWEKPGNKAMTTSITMDTCLVTRDGAEADFSNVFLLDHVLQLFQLCWERTMDLLRRHESVLKNANGVNPVRPGKDSRIPISYLVGCIDSEALGKARGTASRIANRSAKQLGVGPFETKKMRRVQTKKRKKMAEVVAMPHGDRSAEALIAGYGGL